MLAEETNGAEHVHPLTIAKWILAGKRQAGHRLKLEGVHLPYGLRTSLEAVNRFMVRFAKLHDLEEWAKQHEFLVDAEQLGKVSLSQILDSTTSQGNKEGR
jgi:hypothetical protein